MKTVNYEEVQAFLFKESRYLDDQKWDEWLDLYCNDVEFWMPSWDDDNTLTSDPQKEISLIYYPSRDGLEDRIFRIRTERSSATVPVTRTSHNLSNIEIMSQENGIVNVEFNWITLSHRYNKDFTYFGRSAYTIDFSGETPKITRKYIVLKNDYIPTVIDIYQI
jgi:benzoate/toluate 1,2-dioxygenase subunit beta